jgi:hypothetical protein
MIANNKPRRCKATIVVVQNAKPEGEMTWKS